MASIPLSFNGRVAPVLRPCRQKARAAAAAAVLAACGGIDERTPGILAGGSGGEKNPGGSGNGGSSSGGPGGGGTEAGESGSAGALANPSDPCRGCVELVVPVSQPAQRAYFQIEFPEPGVDFSAGLITWRLKVAAADANVNFFVEPFAQNGVTRSYEALYRNRRALVEGMVPLDEWWELTLDLALYPPTAGDGGTVGFDRRVVRWVGIGLGSNEQFSGSGTLRVFLDSVTFAAVSGVDNLSFEGGYEGLTLNASMVPPGTDATHHP